MKAKILTGAVILAIVWTACSKDKYNTTPTLTFTNVNGNEFGAGQVIDFSFQVTDKEGDLQDTIFMKRTSPACSDLNYTAGFEMPQTVPKKFLKADIQLIFAFRNPAPPYITLEGCSERDDTASFKFWIKDKAGHVSDTVQSPTIVLLK